VIDSASTGQKLLLGHATSVAESWLFLQEKLVMKDRDRKPVPGKRRFILRVAGAALVAMPGCGGKADLGDTNCPPVSNGLATVYCTDASGVGSPDAAPGQTDARDVGLFPSDAGPTDAQAVGLFPSDAGQMDAKPIGLFPQDAGQTNGDGAPIGRVAEDGGPMGVGTLPVEAGPMGPLGSAPAEAGPTADGGPVGLEPQDAGAGE
jgi:hypothetical protein